MKVCRTIWGAWVVKSGTCRLIPITCIPENSCMNLHNHKLKAQTLEGEEFSKPALMSAEVSTEWKTFRHYLTKQPKKDMGAQLHELVTNDMLKTMFPNQNIFANICLSIPVSTASVERSFSQMKMIKTQLRNRIGETK